MRYAIIVALLIVGVISVSFAQPQDSDRDTDTTPDLEEDAATNAVSVADFARMKVIGHLGHPLGTIVRVTGKTVDGVTTRQKRDAGKTLLEIDTVNGQRLATTVMFEFQRAPRSVAKPKPGDAFDYYVHEYGSFDGIVVPPKKLGIRLPLSANDGFYYRPHIAIHKSND